MSKIEKTIIGVLICLIILINAFIFFICKNNYFFNIFVNFKNVIASENNLPFQVFQNNNFINSFKTYEEALLYAKKFENSSIKKEGDSTWLWDSVLPFIVYDKNSKILNDFKHFEDAVLFAKNIGADVYSRNLEKVVWSNEQNLKNSFFIKNVPQISQYPELYRGCEVTSLAMLLNYNGIKVDKMTLASQIKKNPNTLKIINNKKYYANPNNGFVGDIYDKNKEGFGVYHKPIFELLKSYAGDNAIDLTGTSFDNIYYYINNNNPVWVIINTKFKKLPPESFETWITEDGEINITYSEHSVLITGYDKDYIYYNDPMYVGETHKKPKKQFIEAWEQMGSQAVVLAF